MTNKDLQKIWQDYVQSRKNDIQADGTDRIIARISKFINQCQEEGLDIKLKNIGWATGAGFKYASATSVSTPLTGIIQIYDSEHLFVYANKSDDEPCSLLYLSMHDIRYNLNEYRSYEYDLQENMEDAFDSFEKRLIYLCATKKSFLDADIYNVSEYKKASGKSLKSPTTSKKPPSL